MRASNTIDIDGGLPVVTVLNRQRGVSVNLTYLRDAARVALRLCAPLRGGGAPVLMSLEEVVVTCVSDKRIDRVHRDFMAVAGATDVITFEHGDILISADTADREARARGHSVSEELLLYIVHGFLHLNGYNDLVESERLHMHAVQDEVWKEVGGQMTRPAC
jgi:probable rRNA maturation factor